MSIHLSVCQFSCLGTSISVCISLSPCACLSVFLSGSVRTHIYHMDVLPVLPLSLSLSSLPLPLCFCLTVDSASPAGRPCLQLPPPGSPVSPQLPRAPAPAFLGARSPAVQIFGCLQGIPGQEGGRWAGWPGVSPAPGGPQARDVLSFASAGARAARPSQQAGSGGRGLLLALAQSGAERLQLQLPLGEQRRSWAGWEGRPRCLGLGPTLSICWVSRKCTLSQESPTSGLSWAPQILLDTSGCPEHRSTDPRHQGQGARLGGIGAADTSMF